MTVVGDVGAYHWSSAQLAADVQAWLDDPGGNHGWMLRGNEADPSAAKKFASRESLDPALAPRLVVEFTPIPAPPTLAVLALVAAAGHRRRRR